MKAGQPSVPTEGCPQNVVVIERGEEPHPERLIGFAMAIGALTDRNDDMKVWFTQEGEEQVNSYNQSMLYQFLNA